MIDYDFLVHSSTQPEFIERPHRIVGKTLVAGIPIRARVEIRNHKAPNEYISSTCTQDNGEFEFSRLPVQTLNSPYSVICYDHGLDSPHESQIVDRVYQVDGDGEPVIGAEKKSLNFDFSGWPYYSDEQETSIVQGTITDHEGLPCAREVRIYNRATGERIGRATSDAETGVYAVKVPKGIEVDRIVLADDSLEILYNDLIDRILIGP